LHSPPEGRTLRERRDERNESAHRAGGSLCYFISGGALRTRETVVSCGESSVGIFVSALRYDMRVETAQEFLAALKA